MKYLEPLKLCQELLKVRAAERGRILGLYVADNYVDVGLSVSGFNNKVASPESVLVRTKTNIDLMATDFQNMMSDYSLSAFVVGYPYHGLKYRQQDARVKASEVKFFVDELSRTGKLEDIQYTYWEEHFASKSVEQLMKTSNLDPSSEAGKTMFDEYAAVDILQGYLDFMNRNVATEERQ